MLTLKRSFMKYPIKFIHFELEKVRGVNLNQTSILLTQGYDNVPLKVKCSFTVKLSQGTSCVNSFKHVYSAPTGASWPNGSWSPWVLHSSGSWTHLMMQTQPLSTVKVKVILLWCCERYLRKHKESTWFRACHGLIQQAWTLCGREQ